MHLYLLLTVQMAVALLAKCSEDVKTQREASGLLREARALPHDKESLAEIKEISNGYVTLRDGRRIKSKKDSKFNSKKESRLNFGLLDSLSDIIDFSSGVCTNGTCMSQKDCTIKNGTDTSDRCVLGFGVCCVTGQGPVNYTGGDVTIGPEGGIFMNPGGLIENITAAILSNMTDFERPSPSGAAIARKINTRQGNIRETEDEKLEYKATLIPPADAVQIKIDIDFLLIYPPQEGDCVNDTLVIKGANPGLKIPELCGVVNLASGSTENPPDSLVGPQGQTLYIDIDNSDGPYEIIISLLCCVEAPAFWSINVTYLAEADAVTRRCLQYHTDTEGTIESFGFSVLSYFGIGMINDQSYSICFGYVSGYCNIGLNFEWFDLGPVIGQCRESYLRIGDDQYCGSYYNEPPQLIVNATGPISIGVRSGVVEFGGSFFDIGDGGFRANYTMMKC